MEEEKILKRAKALGAVKAGRITTKTSLGAIMNAFRNEFNMIITQQMAREIKVAALRGSAIWRDGLYRSTAGYIRYADGSIVKLNSGATYRVGEWNKAVRAGDV